MKIQYENFIRRYKKGKEAADSAFLRWLEVAKQPRSHKRQKDMQTLWLKYDAIYKAHQERNIWWNARKCGKSLTMLRKKSRQFEKRWLLAKRIDPVF